MAGETLSRRTKLVLMEALEDCLRETGKSIEKLTVTELCEKAGINRKTFYYHFEDIEDLCRWAFFESGHRIAEKSDYVEHPDESIRWFVSFVSEHRTLYHALIEYFGFDKMKQMGFADETVFVVPESFRKITSQMKDHGEADFLEFGARFFAEALCDVMYHSVTTEEPQWSAEQIAEYAIRVWHSAAMPIIENME